MQGMKIDAQFSCMYAYMAFCENKVLKTLGYAVQKKYFFYSERATQKLSLASKTYKQIIFASQPFPLEMSHIIK